MFIVNIILKTSYHAVFSSVKKNRTMWSKSHDYTIMKSMKYIRDPGFRCFQRSFMIRNIVFDMGNVIIRFDPSFFISREGIEDLADRELIMNELFLSVEWAQMDSGVLTEETAEPSILSRFPDRLKGIVHNLLFSWADPPVPIPGMEDLVRRLKKAGYGVWLLSNASKAQHLYWPKVPVSGLFDGKLVSCDTGYVKPMREIYLAFTDKYQLLPEECVFIDDSIQNVAGAVACNWHGIVFHGSSEELEQKLGRLGVVLSPAG